MPKPWTEAFDFYFTQLEEQPASVFVDLGARDGGAPLASHPVRLFVRVKMKQPRDNGLRSQEESEALFAYEDALVPALAKDDILYLGRVVTGGMTDLFFFAPAGLTQAKIWSAHESAPGDYEIEFNFTDDPEWQGYFQFLSPSPLEIQLIMNRHVLESLAKEGDRHELPREVDHFAFFADAASAKAAAEVLAEKGFQLDEGPQAPDDASGEWSLSFKRVEAPAAADETTALLCDLLEEFGGTYDGWGCVVKKE